MVGADQWFRGDVDGQCGRVGEQAGFGSSLESVIDGGDDGNVGHALYRYVGHRDGGQRNDDRLSPARGSLGDG